MAGGKCRALAATETVIDFESFALISCFWLRARRSIFFVLLAVSPAMFNFPNAEQSFQRFVSFHRPSPLLKYRVVPRPGDSVRGEIVRPV
jgi:hypothetical protein